MSDPQNDLKRWFHEKTAPHGVKARLAEATGYTSTQISRMRNLETDDPKKRQEIPLDMIEKAARFFDELPPGFSGMTHWVTSAGTVREYPLPVVGYLGAGAEIQPEFEQVPPEGLFEITVPFPLPDEMAAFQVQGESMRPVYKDGHVIIVYRDQRKPLEQFYGHEAAVRTSDGRRFIKTITRGPNNTVTLNSWNADPIEGQSLEWIGEIFAVLPPAAVRHMGRHTANGGK